MLFRCVAPYFILFTDRAWAAVAIKLWMCMPAEGFYCYFCSCSLWEQGKSFSALEGKVLVLTKDPCFWGDSVVTVFLGNLPWFVSASLTWNLITFNKQFYSNIPNATIHILSSSLGPLGLPGIPASVMTIHSESTCWRSSICWSSANLTLL